MAYLKEIVDYFDKTEEDYRKVWDLDNSLALHLGYWDEKVSSLPQALRREDEVMAQKAGIDFDDKVLDAGCGVGGSAIYLASFYGCDVVGITLSENQTNLAISNARRHGVADLTEFHTMNYLSTSFEDASFDVVWGLESICYAKEKRDFLREANRLLKDNGRLIIADAFTAKKFSREEQKLFDNWKKGMSLDSLSSDDDFWSALHEEEFSNIEFEDVTLNVLPSSKLLYKSTLVPYWIRKIGHKLGIKSNEEMGNMISARLLHRLFTRGLIKYYLVYAEKE